MGTTINNIGLHETIHQFDASANGDGKTAHVGEFGTHTLQVTIDGTAKVNFEATIDEETWFPIAGANVTTGAMATSTESSGLFMFPVAGLARFKARVSDAAGSPKVTVRGFSSPIPMPPVGQEVNISVGDIEVGTVKQGARDSDAQPWFTQLADANGDAIGPANPLPTQLTGQDGALPVTIDGIGDAGGALPVKEAAINSFAPRQVVAVTPTRLDDIPLANRRYIDISLVEDNATGYIGNADLIGAENGIPVTKEDGWRLYVPADVPVYGIGGTFVVVEVA